MSGNVTPTSPKAIDAGLAPAEGKQAAVRRSAYRRLDTLDREGKEESSCLQNFACCICNWVSAFFAWLFAPAPRDNPELLADPLKQIKEELAIWKDPNGPMKTLLDEVRKYAKDPTAIFSFEFTPWKKRSDGGSQGFCSQRPSAITVTVADLSNPAAVQSLLDSLIVDPLKKAETALKDKKLYVDLDCDDEVEIKINVKLPTPVQYVDERWPSHGYDINTIAIRQRLQNAWLGKSEPRLHHYTSG